MKVVKAFSPAHITGIFAVERGLNPLTTGSRGVGVTLTKGVHTELKAEPSTRWKVSVKGFGAEIEGEVSRRVVELLASKAPKPYHVEIVHRFEVPVGAGYGASGAGALGVALTLNEALNLGLTPLEAANTAHVAEVECMTGLGTVLAETWGGLSFRVKAGAPSLGAIRKIKAENLYVVSLYWGELSTRGLISNPAFTGFIKRVGNGFLEKFSGNLSVEGFLELSRGFAETLNVLSPRIRSALTFLEAKGPWKFSVNMFGEAVFTLVGEEELRRLLPHLNHPALGSCRVIVAGISEEGVKLEG